MTNFFYNIKPDLPAKLPPVLNPKTEGKINRGELEMYLTKEMAREYFCEKKFIPIPEKLSNLYKEFRPTPLIRAKNLEAYLKTSCRIYFKYEGNSPSGSHKINSALAEVFFAKQERVKTLIAATCGHWGYALSIAAKKMRIKTKVFMVSKPNFDKDKYVQLMKKNGTEVVESPSQKTLVGQQSFLKGRSGMGIAIAEVLENTQKDGSKFAIGSLFDYVLLHNTLIGLEAKEQLSNLDEYPEIIMASCGIGSSLGGISLPFLGDYLAGKNKKIKIVAIEPERFPSLSKGRYIYDNPDSLGILPKLKMYSLSGDYSPKQKGDAGGLEYFGVSPIISLLYKLGFIQTAVIDYQKALSAQKIFEITQGITPMLESAYTIAGLIEKIKYYRDQSILLGIS